MKHLTLCVAMISFSVTTPAIAQEMAAECKSGPFARYLAAAGPKAFAAGKTRGCGWQVKSDTYATSAAIRGKAIEQCQQFGGDNCRIVAEQK